MRGEAGGGDRAIAAGADGRHGPGTPTERLGASRWERRAREVWRGRPPPPWRLAEAAFGAVVDLRHLAYDVGLLRARQAPLPVLSVGGLTVGGGGKTPLAAWLALKLSRPDRRVAVLTRGFADELAVHRRLAPPALVLGHPDRRLAAERAAARGAAVAVLDDGFQHRRLARELDVVVLDADAVASTNLRRLPAGPFRERLAELRRAGAVVVTRRAASGAAARRLAAWAGRRLGGRPVARLRLAPGAVRPANGAAKGEPGPRVALCGIMKPEPFLEEAARRWPGMRRRVALPDHQSPDDRLLDELVREAGGAGAVCTWKDAVKLAERWPPEVPLWVVGDRLAWEAGEDDLLEACERSVGPAPHGPANEFREGREGGGSRAS